MPRRHDTNLLSTIAGTHRRPSTLDVITSCWETDRLLRKLERSPDLKALHDDCDAVLQQAEWLLETSESEPDDERRHAYEALVSELLELEREFQRERDRLLRPRFDGAGLLRGILYVPVTYALAVLFNTIVLATLYGLLVFGGLVAPWLLI